MKKILVVDDNHDVLDAIKALLEMKGYEVHTLADGAKVLERLKKIRPDLILLDVYLSGVNGIDICAQIKVNPALKHIPVVMMSAHSNLGVMLQSCKADAFIEKPYNLTHIVEVIEGQLRRVS